MGTSTVTLPRTGFRHECLHRGSDFGIHTAGDGKPKRKKCARCGGMLMVREGWHGVFVHSSSPNAGPSGAAYRQDDAVSLHTREADAQRVIDADTTGTLVIRWVTP